jgi:serine protease Do
MSSPDSTAADLATKGFVMLALSSDCLLRTACAVLSLGLAATAVGCTPGDLQGRALPSFAPVVQGVMPAVVNVSAVQRASRAAADQDEDVGGSVRDRSALRDLSPSALDELLRHFFEQQDRKGLPGARLQSTALGSGFIIDPNGYVVTDDHVIDNADKVMVTFQDATQHPARIIGRDSMTDLALLKIDADRPLPYVRWGDSDTARVGDWVVAIGNPFGLDNTVSSGIISARGRDIHAGPYDDFLQIDASINRGNSGGPTFDLNGNVIGINTAIYSPNGGSVGIGFAVPANLARPIVEQLKARGRVARGWLAVQIQQVTPEMAASFGLAKAEGALVAAVSPGGPAAKAGFEQGDVILSVSGHDIRRMRDLPLIIADTPIGEVVAVRVWRRNTEITLQPVIGEMPEGPEVAELRRADSELRQPERAGTPAGLNLVPLTQRWRERLRMPRNANGVVVLRIDDDSPFIGLDLLPGDVIQAVNQQPVTSPKDAIGKLQGAAAGESKSVLVLVNRHGTTLYLAMALETAAKTRQNG